MDTLTSSFRKSESYINQSSITQGITATTAFAERSCLSVDNISFEFLSPAPAYSASLPFDNDSGPFGTSFGHLDFGLDCEGYFSHNN
jgi:hypothetical protein